MDILTCAERFVLRAKPIVMRFIKTLWAALFPKPEYPASDIDEELFFFQRPQTQDLFDYFFCIFIVYNFFIWCFFL